MREIAAAVAHRFELGAAAVLDSDLGSDAVPIPGPASQLKTDPVQSRFGLVLEQQWRAGNGQHDQIDPSVVVEIAGTASALRAFSVCPTRIGRSHEFPAALRAQRNRLPVTR